MGAALESLGFRLGDQHKAEMLIEDWACRDFKRILAYCESADAFQDVPFSLDDTFRAVDRAFPNSKFILTVRDSAEEWFESLVRFHTKLIGKGRLPTAGDLQSFDYNGVGWLWRAHTLIFGVDETTLYDRALYLPHYEAHINMVRDYFQQRPGDLLVVNLTDTQAMEELCHFLGADLGNRVMPHLNRSSD